MEQSPTANNRVLLSWERDKHLTSDPSRSIALRFFCFPRRWRCPFFDNLKMLSIQVSHLAATWWKPSLKKTPLRLPFTNICHIIFLWNCFYFFVSKPSPFHHVQDSCNRFVRCLCCRLCSFHGDSHQQDCGRHDTRYVSRLVSSAQKYAKGSSLSLALLALFSHEFLWILHRQENFGQSGKPHRCRSRCADGMRRWRLRHGFGIQRWRWQLELQRGFGRHGTSGYYSQGLDDGCWRLWINHLSKNGGTILSLSLCSVNEWNHWFCLSPPDASFLTNDQPSIL